MDIYEQLRRDEGVRLLPYADSVGKLTIGVGRNLTDVGITQDEATMLLTNDVTKVTNQLAELLPWFGALDAVRAGALVNMGFNLGVVGLLSFHNTLTCIEFGQWDNAAAAMLSSKWAGQVGARATRLAEQIRTGTWQ